MSKKNNAEIEIKAYIENVKSTLDFLYKNAKFKKKYFKKDEEYQIGNKAGKLYKYLIKKEHISCVYENLITMYNERLPQLIDFTNDYYSNYNLGDKNDILLNYFMLKLKENERRFPSTVDELLFVNLYANLVIVTVSNNTPMIIKLDIIVSGINSATINSIVTTMNDKICFCFLSFFLRIGTFSVSAGAYSFIIIMANIHKIAIQIYFISLT